MFHDFEVIKAVDFEKRKFQVVINFIIHLIKLLALLLHFVLLN